MGILDTFYIVFKSLGGKEVEQEQKAIEKGSQALAAQFKAADVLTNNITASFRRLGKQLGATAIGFFAFRSIISNIQSATEYVTQLDKASTALGVNISELDAWGMAAKKAGGSAEEFQSSLRSLSEKLGTTPKTALKALLPLSDALQKMSRFRALKYGKQLGLDENTILLLQKGRREVQSIIAQQKEFGVVTKQDQKVTREFNDAVTDTGSALRGLYVALSSSVLPILTKFFNIVTPIFEYLRIHKDAVVGAFLAIAAVGAILAAPFVAANAAVIAITAGIVALIAVIGIAYEDIKAFLNGQNSLIGDLLKKWPALGTAVKGYVYLLTLPFKALLDIMDAVKSAFLSLFSIFSGNTAKFKASIETGQSFLGIASNSPIASQTSGSILTGGRGARNNSINTGDITINTQATDAQGIAGSMNQALVGHFWQANSYFDDGVAA